MPDLKPGDRIRVTTVREGVVRALNTVDPSIVYVDDEHPGQPIYTAHDGTTVYLIPKGGLPHD